MARKTTAWKTKGMSKDSSVSAFNAEYSFENRNLRLSTVEGNTQMSWVNERGTKLIVPQVMENTEDGYTWDVQEIKGIVIGTAIINHHLVVFTTGTDDGFDYIYVFKYFGTTMAGRILYKGHLNFSAEHPLETLVSYEAENIQKVYWTDGINQPRMVNIVVSPSKVAKWLESGNNSIFDFISELILKEKVTVKKILGGNGTFAPGVIQYAFTYYYMNGQESNIFYTTPLLYTSHKDRGAAPNDVVDNAFEITVSNVDTNFDYIRIYSIQRMTLNDTPYVKRIQDISLSNIKDNKVTYLDTGHSGDSVDPTELLYKGGDTICAETMEQKDNTLFFGNIKRNAPKLDNTTIEEVQKNVSIECSSRRFFPAYEKANAYTYGNQLTSYDDNGNSVSCAGFKRGDYYRCGIQFQHKTGKWSEPIFIDDKQQIGINAWQDIVPREITELDFVSHTGKTYIEVPTFKGSLSKEVADILRNEYGYLKARAVVVFPGPQDRMTLCQGVVCPTMYTDEHRGNTSEDASIYEMGDLYAQSSWFFRPQSFAYSNPSLISNNGSVWPIGQSSERPDGSLSTLNYMEREMGGGIPVDGDAWDPSLCRTIEIQGCYEDKNKFKIDRDFVTFHSPDIEFDKNLWAVDYTNLKCKAAGFVRFKNTLSDILIQTETPTISNAGGGFQHKSFNMKGCYGIVSGLFYDDFIVDEIEEKDITDPGKFGPYNKEVSSLKWMVYLWNKSGSLNNDITRTNGTTRTAELQKKIISNLRYAETFYEKYDGNPVKTLEGSPQVYTSDVASLIKIDDKLYQGNIDTVLMPDYPDGMLFAFDEPDKPWNYLKDFASLVADTPFESKTYWKTSYKNSDEEATDDKGRLYKWATKDPITEAVSSPQWWKRNTVIGDSVFELSVKKEIVRMKYKSTPHLAMKVSKNTPFTWSKNELGMDVGILPIAEIGRTIVPEQLFGGTSPDALRENTWLPCGEPVSLDETVTVDNKEVVQFDYSYGDTYYQRWDCLKTYAFNPDDINQVVEIGSFMLETRVNIDGRYDRNRGQKSNLYMSPTNFNLINQVYSQTNNFFSYKITPTEEDEPNVYPNYITWSRAKEPGADVDLWTNVTLGATLALDGDKGEVRAIRRLNDQLIAFQDSGISNILYNENVQISSTQGVPIELANSGKVQGKRYLTDTVGCSNKWSIVTTPSGLYFMDSNEKSIYLFNGQLHNISVAAGFNVWAKNNIPSAIYRWTPLWGNGCFIGQYDKISQDILFINKDIAVAYSEKFQTFTSFYDYGSAPFLCNLDDIGVWVKGSDNISKLWQHHAGEYCRFFGVDKPYSTILVGNPEPFTDKIFTNLELRANIEGDGLYKKLDGTFTPITPFDTVEIWNDYQHGIAIIGNKQSHDAMAHHKKDRTASIKRKDRIWRLDIPRDNALIDKDKESSMGITRFTVKPLDRIRNPWAYIKLQKEASISSVAMSKIEIHDIIMTYFN